MLDFKIILIKKKTKQIREKWIRWRNSSCYNMTGFYEINTFTIQLVLSMATL